MTRFLSIVLVIIVGSLSFLAVKYAKESYKILPIKDTEENHLESKLDTQNDYQNWQEFAPPSNTFKVLMPSIPQHVSDKTHDAKTKSVKKVDMYMAEKKNGTIYMINIITFPDSPETKVSDDEILNNFMNDMVAANPNNKLVASQPAVYKGNKSLDFVIENDIFNYNVREFLHGSSLIVLSSISRKPYNNMKEFEFFINSFEFAKAEQKTQK